MTKKMKMKSEVMSLFSTPVVETNIGRDFTKKELQLFLTDIPMEEDIEQGASNHRSEDYYLFDTFTEELGDIKKFIEFHLKQYMEHIEGVDTDLATLRITQSWLNNTKPQEYHHPHSHSNSYLSGVFYIQCLPNDNLNFEERPDGNFNNIEFHRKRTTVWNAKKVRVDVKEGDLLMFPSWIRHFVNRNETKKERISLAFNTFPIGELGEYHDATHLKL